MSNIYRRLMFVSLLLISVYKMSAQWAYEGPRGFSYSTANDVSEIIGTNDEKYVVFSDFGLGNKILVKEFDGLTWQIVGDSASMPAAGRYVSLALDKHNMPYIVFADQSRLNTITVMKYDSTQNAWDTVGTHLSAGPGYLYTSMVIDSLDNIYIAYCDQGNSYKASVKKFNGNSWSVLGTTNSLAYYLSLALNMKTGDVYLAFDDGQYGNKATVEWVNSWTTVGNPAFTNSSATFTSLAVDTAGTLLLTYNSNSSGPKVMRYINGGWSNLGNTNIVSFHSSYNRIIVSKNDSVFIAFQDSGYRATVMKLNNNVWELVGSRGFTPGYAYFLSLATDTMGAVYLAFQDASQGYKASVMKKECSSADIPILSSDTAICSGNWIRLSVVGGELNSASYWQWFQDSCNGTLIDTGKSIFLSPSFSSSYYVRAHGGCLPQPFCANVTVHIDSLVIPAITIRADTDDVCEGSLITFSASITNGGAMPVFNWKKNSISIGVSDSSYFPTDLLNGDTISCTMTSSACVASSLVSSNNIVVHLIANPSVAIQVQGPLQFCYDDSIRLNVDIIGAGYLWNTGDTVQTITVKQPGTYIVTVTQNGCSRNDSITATTSTGILTPSITYSPSLTFCSGGHTILNAGSGYETYSWNTGESTQTITADTAGVYFITVSDGSCQGSDSVIVQLSNNTLNVQLLPGVNIIACNNDTIVAHAGLGYDTYSWSDGDTTEYTNVTSQGYYDITVTRNGCFGYGRISATYFQVPLPAIISTANSDSICRGITDTLSLNNVYTSYLWNTGAVSPKIGVRTQGIYSVTVTKYGCNFTPSNSADIHVISPVNATFQITPNSYNPYYPNGYNTIVVSPADGQNYYWMYSFDTTGSFGPYDYSFITREDSFQIFCSYVKEGSLEFVNAPFVRVIVADKYGCIDSSSWQYIENCLVGGIESISGITDVSLSPNPAVNNLQLSFGADVPGKTTITIYDITGRIVEDVLDKNLSPGSHEYNIPITDLSLGTYYVKIENVKGHMVLRFIKQ